MQALTPFLAEACLEFSGQMFDAEKFSHAVEDKCNLKIPRLAVLGLAEQLANDGYLEDISGLNESAVYKFSDLSKNNYQEVTPVTEQQIESILQEFVQLCSTEPLLSDLSDDSLHDALLERLLNVDSMQILSRREGVKTAKKTENTLILPVETLNDKDRIELHLDYLVSQFLIDLRNTNADKFEEISDVAFANMAAEALACFREPPEISTELSNLTVYLDTPLILDMLGVNDEYSDYGKELLKSLIESKATPAVFEHSINEAENAVQAKLGYLRSGVNQNTEKYSYSAKPDLLNALAGNVADRVTKRLNIEVQKDPEVALHKRLPTTVGSIEKLMEKRMSQWRRVEAVSHDRQSIFTLIAISDSNQPSNRVCESKSLFLTRNTALVSIANDMWKVWLKDSNKKSTQSSLERVAPIAMSDKQFSGYLWARSGSGNGTVSKARLLAHCSSAIRPRADIKAKAYNMVLELNGKDEADDIAALMEDREGVNALMRVTKGDPEDITPERMPFIIDKVKKAAGEYAAADVRRQKQIEIDMQQDSFAAEIRNNKEKLADESLKNQELKSINSALEESLKRIEASTEDKRNKIEKSAHNKANFLYHLLKWAISLIIIITITFSTGWMASSKLLTFIVTFIFTSLTFWFLPEKIFGGILTFIARKRFESLIQFAEPELLHSIEGRDFSKKL